ncbi:DegV family protein [Candidatus Phytoplasma oryzae]|nr:DegV family protein [Candidatus Phytoplasma oryzae]
MTLSLKKIIKVTAISTSCLDYYKQKPDNIDLIRIKILIDNTEYNDGADITSFDFYQLLEKNSQMVIQTSQPSLGELIHYFKKLSLNGYKKVFIPTLSDKLSGTYSSINNIVQNEKELQKDIEIIPYNTNTVSFSEGYFALEAERLFSQGSTTEQVIEHLDFLKKNNTIFFVVNSLNRLINSGRLTKTKGFFGRLLRIKPILQLNEKGEIKIIEKKIKLESALDFIVDKVKNYLRDIDKKNFLVYLTFSNCEKKLKEKLKFIIKEKLKIDDILEMPVSPAIGAHLGDNVIGLGVFRL